MSVKDDLANIIADNLNKKFNDNKVAYFLDGSDDTPTDIKDFISTGSSMVTIFLSMVKWPRAEWLAAPSLPWINCLGWRN